MNDVMVTWVNGEWIRVMYGDPGPEDLASWDSDSKTVTLRPNQSLREEADCLLHELMHHRWPWLEENEVRQAATEFIRALSDWGVLRK